ncbi:MAG: hypothetical protein M1816_006387 [Peltula sp. TS41687]|nr:MAG: hypothetical protein M1816_006387 [Peltula sp. TS41687]
MRIAFCRRNQKQGARSRNSMDSVGSTGSTHKFNVLRSVGFFCPRSLPANPVVNAVKGAEKGINHVFDFLNGTSVHKVGLVLNSWGFGSERFLGFLVAEGVAVAVLPFVPAAWPWVTAAAADDALGLLVGLPAFSIAVILNDDKPSAEAARKLHAIETAGKQNGLRFKVVPKKDGPAFLRQLRARRPA